MKKIVVIILFTFLLFGCVDVVKKFEKPKKISETELLPSWINGMNSKDYVVGISRKSNDRKTMEESAKQMAAVMMNRNNSSFVIKNYANTESENFQQSGSAKFAMNVGSSPRKLKKIHKKLKLVDEAVAYGYFFGLYSIKGGKTPSKHKIKNKLVAPSWFKEDYFVNDKKKVVFHSKATSIDLKIAWENASENVRAKFARYLVKNVYGNVKVANDKVRKDIAMESRLMLENLVIRKSYFVVRNEQQTWKYDVYLEMVKEK